MKVKRITGTTQRFLESSDNSKALLGFEFDNRSVKRFGAAVEKWLKERGEWQPVEIRVHNDNYLFATAELHDQIVLFKSTGFYA